MDENFFNVLDQFIKFATKAAFDHFFYRYTQLGEHLSDNNRIDQIFTLIVGIKPTRMLRWIKRFARDASAVVLPEPKKPPAKMSFTGFLTDSVLLGLMLSPPVPGSVYR
jgi:hypothetical protein